MNYNEMYGFRYRTEAKYETFQNCELKKYSVVFSPLNLFKSPTCFFLQ